MNPMTVSLFFTLGWLAAACLFGMALMIGVRVGLQKRRLRRRAEQARAAQYMQHEARKNMIERDRKAGL